MFWLLWVEKKIAVFFSWFQIGMMVEMARQPPNLDNLMNEGIAFVIDKFKHRIPQCPIGKRPVMIGRRKASYNTIDSHETLGLDHECHVSHEFYCH